MRTYISGFIALTFTILFISSCTGDRVPEANVDTIKSDYGTMTGANNIDTGVIVSRDYSSSGGNKSLKDTSGKLVSYKLKPAAASVKKDTVKKDTALKK